MNQQAIREAFENAVDTYHIYGEKTFLSHCEKQVESHSTIAESLLWAYYLNYTTKGKELAWIVLMDEFKLCYLEKLAIRYFGYDPKDYIRD